ncbi:LytTR family transcriptional regulator DNA-binding domain-containing protein [Shouchella miscanthi]|uniref:LytTR family transcriptional regulator DNA-binding domain-containing protein n=1 Tax=Shouchella miscanthi TaxID=2598861 RepID=A0ABU6NMI8_9BACI|nr:LytTR family transcriptional regulator DNA-binding domain-containing protein [Shouchella miscanthi]MED4129418.1 LytTR family transcriptional regulator DNA-binding domain-containing protein [Shouchella miscanthi]
MTLVTLENVWKQEENQTILKNISFSLDGSSHVGMKMNEKETATLFELVCGEQIPSSGKIEREAGLILQDRSDDGQYEPLTVQYYLRFFKKIADFQKPLEAFISIFSLSDVWHKKIKDLTKEQKKRVSLFRIYLFSPEIVLLENPLNTLSDEGIELYIQALAYVQNQGIATLITSNYIEDLLLVSKQVYRYRSTIGLETTDLVEEPDGLQNEKVEYEGVAPKNIFKVSCKMADKLIFFSPDEIDYIESINSVSHIRIEEDSFPTDLTMNELEEKLRTFGFFRCHRSYLVNLQRVSELISYSKNSYTLILKGSAQAKLPLSRNRLDEMKKLLTL